MSAHPSPVTTRKPHPSGRVAQLWAQREALYALTFRQIRGRFAQPVVGLFWLLLQPVLQALVFSLFFGLVIRVPSDGTPYPAMVFTGVSLWHLVQRSASEGANAFLSAAPLLRQTPMPRLYPVLASVIGSALDSAIALFVATLTGLALGTHPGWALLSAPLFFLAAVLASLGLSSLLAGICGIWRDARQLVPLGLQILMFASPVIYPAALVPERFAWLYALNPFAGSISGLRWALLGSPAPPWPLLGLSLTSTLVVAIFGLWSFGRLEGRSADAL